MGNNKSTTAARTAINNNEAASGTTPPHRPKKTTSKKNAQIQPRSSSISSQGNRRPLLSTSKRAIIKYCLENARDDIADRILRRVGEKRDDFKPFLDNLSKAQTNDIAEELKRFIFRVCDTLMDCDEVIKLSEDFGSSHVQFRTHGFKPDFFACTADAVTTECTFLDQATHTPSETAAAWSQLSAFVFTAVRDGYYSELRKQRKSSSANRSRFSVDVVSSATDDASLGEDPPTSNKRSASPAEGGIETRSAAMGAADEQALEEQRHPSGNLLVPPQIY
ncbi:unnamed protein product [Caenorhabditis auriculariae]|uniref:Globin family profile domain-containing protein n=1 Tax=Caenorhabditis auriculariae TaxID=2777116 RepID=A0A8S1HUI9_9PELO|nr:unnamed protein product [Caenorhabditis auriculariae]